MAQHEEEVLRITRDWPDEPDKTIRLLTEFLSTNPQSARVKLRLAAIHGSEYGEDIPGAEHLYREILREDSGNVYALASLALLQGSHGSQVTAEESLRLLSEAADLSGEPWAIHNLANAYWSNRLFEEALSAFEWLLSVARARRLEHSVRIAEKSIGSIQRGEMPTVTAQSVPDNY